VLREDAVSATRSSTIPVEQGNESEIVIAIVRTVMIGLAALAFSPEFALFGGVEAKVFRLSMLVALLFNIVLLILYWRGIYLGRRRYLLLLADLVLVSVWAHFSSTLDVDLVNRMFALCYLLVIVAAIWYGVRGALTAACAAIGFFVIALLRQPDTLHDFVTSGMTYRFPILGLIALLAGYLWDSQRRERESWYETQRLLTIYQERIRMSQALYELFVPQSRPAAPGLEVGLRFRPALRMGAGDYYDVLPLERDRLGICIADVAGKVAVAAVKVPILKYALKVAASLSPSPGEVLTRVNQLIYSELQPDLFVTACYLVIVPPSGELAYANAGHQPPILVPRDSGEPRPLTNAAMPFGVDQGVVYSDESLVLGSGDTLILYTDGVTDARNRDRQDYGEERLLETIRHAARPERTAQEVAQAIFDDITEFSRQGERRDDMTIMVVRLAPGAGTA
jgi:serine phosphatase RsbU (regulator of sigma subunit)